MAVSTSSSNSDQVLQVKPLHEQNNIIDGPANDFLKSELSSWDSCQECSVLPECNACPHCPDRCNNENCAPCASKSMSTNALNNNPFKGDEKYFTTCQVARHDHQDSCWLLVGDTIYDATTYIAKHPGGKTSILKKSGGKVDCTVDFDFHSKHARKTWKKYKVGKVIACPSKEGGFGKDEQCTIS